MCGFAAIVSLNGGKPGSGVVARMTALLAHRGPDAEGSWSEGAFAVGFRRLAILDLAASGHQPMHSADGRLYSYSTAIHNYVRRSCSLGHVFRSSGDTEVLLAAYREWGERCLERLNGMWAFLVYDRVARRIFGARDRFGVKPLYTWRDARHLVFASEIKAIRDSGVARLSPDRRSIARFLLEDRLDDSERTFYEGVTQIAAGTSFEVDAAGRLRTRRYWSLDPARGDETEPVREYGALLDDAIRLRLRSVCYRCQLGRSRFDVDCVAGASLGEQRRKRRTVRVLYLSRSSTKPRRLRQHCSRPHPASAARGATGGSGRPSSATCGIRTNRCVHVGGRSVMAGPIARCARTAQFRARMRYRRLRQLLRLLVGADSRPAPARGPAGDQAFAGSRWRSRRIEARIRHCRAAIVAVAWLSSPSHAPACARGERSMGLEGSEGSLEAVGRHPGSRWGISGFVEVVAAALPAGGRSQFHGAWHRDVCFLDHRLVNFAWCGAGMEVGGP